MADRRYVGDMPGPGAPRWTHVALPVADLDVSIAWYETFTPLALIQRRADEAGQSAWLSHPAATEHPFVLVLVDFNEEHGCPQPKLFPFAHLGIELPERADVDEIAVRAAAHGCLEREPIDLPQPVGYVCMVRDPDGNVVEFSHDQRVYDTFRHLFDKS
jgi:lactoylglutathione lyase